MPPPIWRQAAWPSEDPENRFRTTSEEVPLTRRLSPEIKSWLESTRSSFTQLAVTAFRRIELRPWATRAKQRISESVRDAFFGALCSIGEARPASEIAAYRVSALSWPNDVIWEESLKYWLALLFG